MKALKNTFIALLLVLVVVVVLQNTEEVETKVLFMSVFMPRALLLFTTLAVGIIIGLMLGTKLPSLGSRDS